MGDIVDLNKNKPIGKEAVKLFNFGTDIDQVMIHYLKEGMDHQEMCIVVSHRLGELIRTAPDKENVMVTAIETMKAKAGVS